MNEHRILINIASAAGLLSIMLAGITFGFIPPVNPPSEQGALRAQDGKIGVNTSIIGSSLTVNGGAGIGSYATTTSAPKGVMFVEGGAGIGENASNIKGSLNLNGTIAIGRTVQFGSWDARFPIAEGTEFLSAFGGRHISMTIGSDGFPIVSYYGGGAGVLGFHIIKCQDARCDLYTDTRIETSGALASADNSLIMGSDNLPILAYNYVNPASPFNVELRIAKCANVSCIGPITKTTIDPNGYSPSIRINPENGFPVIAYYQTGSPNKLVLVKCKDSSCATFETPKTIDDNFILPSGGVVFGTVSLAIGYDGFPVMSYYASTTGSQRLRVAKCRIYDCSLGPILTSVGSSEKGSGYHNSITIGLDGLPVIATVTSVGSVKELSVIKCLNIACSSSNINTVDSASISPGWNSGEWSTITLGINGFPVVSYVASSTAGSTNQTLAARIAVCSSSDCASGKNTLYELEQNNSINYGTTVAIGSHGMPMVAYRVLNGFNMVTCGSDRCLPYWTR